MKRGWLLLAILILSTVIVSAQEFNLTSCWAVKFCGDQSIPCGLSDGICPDDLFSPASNPFEQGGCGKFFPETGYQKCLDPDCKICIEGTTVLFGVQDTEVNGIPLNRLPGVNINYSLQVSDGTDIYTMSVAETTNSTGEFYMEVPSGNFVFITATKPGYTPDFEGPLYNVSNIDGCIQLDFTLANGTCQSDCTISGSPYCAPACEGQASIDTPDDLCVFNKEEVYQGIELDITPYEACTQAWGAQTGSIVDLGRNDTHCVYTNCCEGEPYVSPCPTINLDSKGINVDEGGLRDLVKTTRLSRLKGRPLKIVLHYWE